MRKLMYLTLAVCLMMAGAVAAKTAPPFAASCLFSASRSASSPTQGLQVVNQKFTTVTVFPAKSVPLWKSRAKP